MSPESKEIITKVRAGHKISPMPKHLEYLTCGHQNNLKLKGRTTGVCPKGCESTVICSLE